MQVWKEFAKVIILTINFVTDINSQETVSWIKSKNPDIIFCFGWSSLIKKELLNLPPMGF
jgi:methionyl-tRNA formyltransferase